MKRLRKRLRAGRRDRADFLPGDGEERFIAQEPRDGKPHLTSRIPFAMTGSENSGVVGMVEILPRSLHYGPQKARAFGRDDSFGVGLTAGPRFCRDGIEQWCMVP